MAMFHFFDRSANGPDQPAGVTVSKRPLPDGDFGITEYLFGDVSLWFLDDDNFTESERQHAYRHYLANSINRGNIG